MEKYIVNPVKVRMKETKKGSVYQAIVAMGFRARQINDDIKMELNSRMADVIPSRDEDDVINHDQLNISREFDRIPKPTFLAMKETYEDKLKFGDEKELKKL